MSRAFLMAGFEVTLNGRFWVTPEGEELWWRGYVLPRQELAFGRSAWVIHGICWSVFHLFMQPTLWDTIRMAITGVALSFVAQRTRSTWPGIIGHSFGNLAFFLSLISGVTS